MEKRGLFERKGAWSSHDSPARNHGPRDRVVYAADDASGRTRSGLRAVRRLVGCFDETVYRRRQQALVPQHGRRTINRGHRDSGASPSGAMVACLSLAPVGPS